MNVVCKIVSEDKLGRMYSHVLISIVTNTLVELKTSYKIMLNEEKIFVTEYLFGECM